MTTSRSRVRGWLIVIALAVGASVARAGVTPGDVVNPSGWTQVERFLAAAFAPRLDREFVGLVITESLVTVGYAVVGTALAIVIGFVGGVASAERSWTSGFGETSAGRRIGWTAVRAILVVPRAVHEVVVALLLVSVLGLDPLVPVLAIGVPFGAVTAKVFSELLDEVPVETERVLLASGASRPAAFVYGVLPRATGALVSYGFYRFECSLRSAAVLGVVGAGGLGFQLALSFTSLRYDEMWTLLWALIILSGIVDAWSSAVRRRQGRFVTSSVVVATAAVPAAVIALGLAPWTLWSERTRRLTGELAVEAWPPQPGAGGWRRLAEATVDTLALAVLATALAWLAASVVAAVAARPSRRANRNGAGPARLVVGGLARFGLLVARSVPPPVGAFIAVFVLFPGLWPGVVALAVYNLGVLGRLQAEVVEHTDRSAIDGLRSSGGSAVAVAAYGMVPLVAARFAALGLYRWEVAIRDTVMVGVVGAGGLGVLLDEQTSTFDYDGIGLTVSALLVVTVAVDLASAAIRRDLR